MDEDFHIERDTAYTIISVPNQVIKTNRLADEYACFKYKITESLEISLPMVTNLCFMYNANFLMHRQEYVADLSPDGNRFYNISSYANEKLFNHLRKSFQRTV